MSLIYNVEIPIKAHLKCFLAGHYQIDPYTLSMKDAIGPLLFNALERPVLKHQYYDNRWNDTLEVIIPTGYTQFNKVASTENTARAFNHMIEHIFKDSFHRYMDYYMQIHEQIGVRCKLKKGIMDFIFRYDLIDHMDYETLKKDYYRFRKKREKMGGYVFPTGPVKPAA